MASSEQAIVYKVSLVGADQVQAGARAVSSALGGTATGAREGSEAFKAFQAAAGRSTVAINTVSEASGGLNRNVFKAAGAVKLLARDAVAMGVDMNGVEGQIMGVVRVSRMLTSTIGLSVGGGLAAAGLIMGVQSLVSWFKESSAKAKEAEERQNELNKALVDYDTILGKIQRNKAKGELYERLGTGVSTREEMEAETTRLRTQAKQLYDKSIKEGSYQQHAEEIVALGERAKAYERIYEKGAQRRLEIERDTRRIDMAEALVDTENSENAKEQKKKAIIDHYRLMMANEERIRKLDQMMQPQGVDLGPYNEKVQSQARLFAQWKEADEKRAVDMTMRRAKEAEDAVRAAEKEKQKSIRETHILQTQTALQAATVVANVGQKSLQDLVKGKKLEAGAIIETIGDGLYADGWSNVLKAAAMAWIPGLNAVAAPGLAAAGATEMAVGLSMGAIGSRESGGSASKSGNPASTTVSTTGVERQRDQYNAGTPVASGPITINVSTLNPSRETGETIYKSLREAGLADSSYRIRKDMLSP